VTVHATDRRGKVRDKKKRDPCTKKKKRVTTSLWMYQETGGKACENYAKGGGEGGWGAITLRRGKKSDYANTSSIDKPL